ncbi:MAG: DUF2304 domain-containing protein [Lachnospiraceae bacterium]|nr:DUF2304 domain-containing protein [Lachnospiraceae bacterium]
MSPTMRVLLLVAAVFMAIYVGRKLRRSQFQINDSMFWIIMAFVLVLFAVFPQIAEWAADVVGVESPANLVYLVMIFLMMVRIFLLTIRVSQLEDKLKNLAEEVALKDEKISKS